MRQVPDQEWWTAAELADAALPDMPGTKRGVNDVAKRQGWQVQPGKTRKRAGRGGGVEYHWSILPARARTQLLSTADAVAPEPIRSREDVWADFEQLPNTMTAKARMRVEVLQGVETLVAANMTRDHATREMAAQYGVSPRSIWNWAEMVRGVSADDWLAYVAPRFRRGSTSTVHTVDADFGERLKSDYLRLAQPSFRSCYDRAAKWAKAAGVEVPPLHTSRRWYQRGTSKPTEVLARKGMEALKRLYPAQIRDRSKLHALEGINGDYHRFDVFVRMQTPEGPKVLRPQMVAFQDLYSGKIVAWRLSYSANSQTVQLCIGEMIETWGIPKHVVLDNGREFAAKAITGGTPTRFRFEIKDDDIPGLLTTLGCVIHWATPYSGQSKPIERAFRDMCDRIARHPACEGAYTGNRPDAKPENWRTRVLEQSEFEELVTTESAEHNARPDRRSEVAYGRSFDEVFSESYARAPIRKATAEQRRLWLLGAKGVSIGRTTGRISFMGNAYFSEWLHEHLGEKVVDRFDDRDLWSGLHIYALSGEYLGPVDCQEKVGFFDAHGARAVKRARIGVRKAVRAQVDAERTLTAAEIAAGVRAATPPTPPRPEAALVEMPKPHKRAAKVTTRTAEEERPLEQIVTSMDRHRAKRSTTLEDERDLFARALDLEAAIARGETILPDQQRWLRSYQTHPDYRAQKLVAEQMSSGKRG